MDSAANSSPIDGLLSRLTPAETVELRSKLGPLCLWCGAPATLLCDSRIEPGVMGRTCDAPICPQHAKSKHIRGVVCGFGGCESLNGTIDDCPACVQRRVDKERCDHRTPEQHAAYVRAHAALGLPMVGQPPCR